MVKILSNVIEHEELKKNLKKSLIILADTKRPYKCYINSLIFRYNKKNPHLPNYVINKDGEIFMITKPENYSDFVKNPNINKKSIVIILENLTWLKKIPIENYYLNWIGDIYKENVFEKKWRECFFWDTYTQKQIESLVFLTNEMCEKFNIPKETTKTNVKLFGIENFKGIFAKSNYDANCKDINPSFNFNRFEKLLNDYEPVR